MQDINGNLVMQWNNDYWKIHKKILNSRRTIQEAKQYMEENYIYCGSRKAFNYLMYAHPQDIKLEDKLYLQLCDAIKLGFGNDYNFERAFR